MSAPGHTLTFNLGWMNPVSILPHTWSSCERNWVILTGSLFKHLPQVSLLSKHPTKSDSKLYKDSSIDRGYCVNEFPSYSCVLQRSNRKVVIVCSVIRMNLCFLFKLSCGKPVKWGFRRPSRVPRTERGRWSWVLNCGKPLLGNKAMSVCGPLSLGKSRGSANCTVCWEFLQNLWSVLSDAEQWGTYDWHSDLFSSADWKLQFYAGQHSFLYWTTKEYMKRFSKWDSPSYSIKWTVFANFPKLRWVLVFQCSRELTWPTRTLSPTLTQKEICHEWLETPLCFPFTIFQKPNLKKNQQNILFSNTHTAPICKHQACDLAGLQPEHLGYSGCCQWLKECSSILVQPTQ